jgi:hypothetical protein
MNISVEELGESVVGWAQLGNLKLVKSWAEKAKHMLDLDFQTGNCISPRVSSQSLTV